MKKRFATLLSLALAGTMCFGLTACTIIQGGSQSGGQKFSDAEFDASWASAFDERNFENFKATCKSEVIMNYEATESMAETATVVRADGREHWVSDLWIEDLEGMREESYYYNGRVYQETNGQWNSSSGEPRSRLFTDLFLEFKTKGRQFIYDADTGYVFVTGSESTSGRVTYFELTKYTFVFQNGRISRFIYDQYEYSYDSEGYLSNTVYDIEFTYGGQKVTFPKDLPVVEGGEEGSHTHYDYDGDGFCDEDNEPIGGTDPGELEEVTPQTGERISDEDIDAVWAAAFDSKNFENFRMTVKVRLGGMPEGLSAMTITLVRVGTLELVQSTGLDKTTTMYFYDGTTYYQKNDAGDWEETNPEDKPTVMAILSKLVKPKRYSSEAVYSEEKGGYVVGSTLILSKDAPVIPTTNVLCFKDNHLVGFTTTFQTEDDSFPGGQVTEFTITIDFTYGGQSVTPPEGLAK